MFRLQRQKAEKPRDKVDFRFLEFQTTQVPISCDKLVVTVISVETGKAVARTNKALVRCGSCQWSEAVSESVRFLQQDASKDIEEKLFKFVVSTGSPRAGILGEATINLADYLTSKVPVPLSLPLKKCNHGTILHVKIHCLTPRLGSRQTEHLREAMIEQDDQNSVSDDMDNRSEGSDHMIGGSVGSSSGNRLGHGFIQNKDGASSPSSSRFSSDSGEILSSGSSTANGNSIGSTNNLPRRQDAAGSRDSNATNRTGNAQDSFKSSPSSPFNGKGTGSVANLHKQWQERSTQGSYGSTENITRASLTRGNESYKGLLEAAEATIQELRTEAMMWERNARKLGAEMDTLKHQFDEQTKHQSDLEMEFSAAEAERDRLKLEVEQLKSSLQDLTERESSLNNTRFEADDAKRIIQELQEEIDLEKQSNANLDLQLRKTQESNMELVSALQELEETIQQQTIEIDNFSEERQKLRDLEGLKPEAENAKFTIQRLQEEIEIEKASNGDLSLQLQETEESYKGFLSVVQDLEEKLKKQDMEIEHLSDGNKRFEAAATEHKMQSISVEAKWMQKLSLKEEEIRKLEAQISSFEIQKSLTDGAGYRDESPEDLRIALEKSKREIDELERDCKELTDENMELIFKLNKLNKYLESKNISISELEEKEISLNDSFLNGDAPMKIKMKTSSDEVEINELKAQLVQLEFKLKSSENSHVELTSMEASLDQLKNKVLELENQNSGLEIQLRSFRDRNCFLENELGTMEQQLDTYASREKHLQGTIHQLESENIDLQAEIQSLKEEQRSSRSKEEELEFQLSLLTEETQLLISSKHEFELQALNLQMEKVDLEDKLLTTQEESKAAKARLDELGQELARLTGSTESQISAKRSLEKKSMELESTKKELERHLTDLEVENVQLSERILGLEAQLRYITEERESYKLDLENTKTHGIELETNLQKLEIELRGENMELQKSLHESENKLSVAFEEAESYKKEHRQLQLKLDSLNKGHAETKAKQNEEILNLSVSRANLEEQLQELRGRFSYSVTQAKSLESELATLQKDMAEKEREWSLAMEALLASKKENEQKVVKAEAALSQVHLEKSTTVQYLENEVQRLTNQMSSTYDEKEKMATKALIEASELRAEKAKLEDSLHEIQGKIRHCEMELSSTRRDYENKVQELVLQITAYKEKEEDMNFRQENAQRKLEEIELNKENFKKRMHELEKQIQLIETENQRLKEEYAVVSSQAHEAVTLRNTVEDIRSERSRLESSLQFSDVELGRLRAEKQSMAEKLTMLQAALSEVDGLKRAKAALEEKLLRLQAELSAKDASSAHGAEHKNESIRLKRVNTQFQRKLQDIEEEREELKNKVKLLEEELKLKTDSLSKSEQKFYSISNNKKGYTSPSRDTKEVVELREKLRFAESEITTLVKEFEIKERELCARIGYLENVNNQVKQVQGDSRTDHWQLELTKLQEQNSSLSHREHELKSKLGDQEQLQKEVEKLQEANKQLQSQLSKFKETAKSGDLLDRVLALETELAEALESNAMYKSQLKSFLSQEQNVHVAALQNLGSVDQVVNDLTRFKRTSSSLETELKDLRERYFKMSLQFAEVEAQREQLVMQVKNLKNGRRWF